MLIYPILQATKTLVSCHPAIKAFQRKREECCPSSDVSEFDKTLEAADESLADVTGALALILTVVFFGPVVPVLFVLAPALTWVQLCALDMSAKHKAQISIGKELASAVFAQVRPCCVLCAD